MSPRFPFHLCRRYAVGMVMIMNPTSIKDLCKLEPSQEYAHFLGFKDLLTEPVVIYGAGYCGRELFRLCRKLHIPVAAICDRNLAGIEDQELGMIESFQEASARLKQYQVIIASQTYKNEIEGFIRSIVPDCEILHFAFPLLLIKNCAPPDEYRRFLEAHSAEFQALADMLEDDKSRSTLLAVLKARLTWDLHDLWTEYVEDQYFPAEVVKLSPNEVFFDCGAWTGDTLEQLMRHTGGRIKKAVCFEPGERQARELSFKFSSEIRNGRVEVVPECLSDRAMTVHFKNCVSSMGSHIVQEPQEGDVLVPASTIDLAAQREPDVTFIKMDIEGAELAALKGAEQTIRRCRPKLAICVYHKIDDLIQIPKYIERLGMKYRFFLRHHSNSICETVLYAV